LASEPAVEVDDHGGAEVRRDLFGLARKGRQDEDAIVAAELDRFEVPAADFDPVIGHKEPWADQGERTIPPRGALQPSDQWVLKIGDQQPLAERFQADQPLREEEQLAVIRFEAAKSFGIDAYLCYSR
jgi:hypothetical protein